PRVCTRLPYTTLFRSSRQGILDPDEETLVRLGKEVVKEEYGNLFDMYEKITGENPYEVPMSIYPAVHYTMGGLWVDYELMTTVKDRKSTRLNSSHVKK